MWTNSKYLTLEYTKCSDGALVTTISTVISPYKKKYDDLANFPGLLHDGFHGHNFKILPEQYSYPWCQTALVSGWFFALTVMQLWSAQTRYINKSNTKA